LFQTLSIMTEQESLQIILSMIDKTKSNLKHQSGFYLVWGWSIFIATSLEYGILVLSDYPYHFLVWPIAILFAIAATIFLSTKMKGEKRVTTYADKALKYLWASWSVVLFLVLAFPAFGNFSWGDAYLFIIALYGLGAAASGGVLNFKPLIYGGIFSFVLAAVAMVTRLYSDFPTMLLFLALSILGSFLIPGFLLRKS